MEIKIKTSVIDEHMFRKSDFLHPQCSVVQSNHKFETFFRAFLLSVENLVHIRMIHTVFAIWTGFFQLEKLISSVCLIKGS